MNVLWHLITSNDTIVRSTHASNVHEARLRLAPIREHEMVVSAVSYDVKETREVKAIREQRCEACGELMSKEPAGIYSTVHRSCYERQWRTGMDPERKAAFMEKRRLYKQRERGR